MQTYGMGAQGIAIACGTVLSALFKHLEAKQIIVRDDARAILKDALGEIARIGVTDPAREAAQIVNAMLADFPERRS